MLPGPDICERARLARDERFDGRFFVAVRTTRIYCRPVCPARAPAKANVSYFATAAAAQEAGYRPCFRCRPERARPTPEWVVKDDRVRRGLRLIADGFLNEQPTGALAERLCVSTRQMNRLFHAELGALPLSLARQQRIELAKRLIDDTELPLAEVALAAGFRSVRRFNAELLAAYGRPPRELRRGAVAASPSAAGLAIFVPLRQPYDHRWVFTFHHKRALQGLETVTLGALPTYERRLDTGGHLSVTWVAGKRPQAAAGLRVCSSDPVGQRLVEYLGRVRRMFDTAADSELIDRDLRRDAAVGRWVARAPGLRVPGAWDGFEQAVRAILGQQVSVARATDLANRLIDRYGERGAFPTAEALARAQPAEIGMPGSRGDAIASLAAAVAAGDLSFDAGLDAQALTEALCSIKGIGPWTAGYVAMRIARDPDAYPDKDWVVLKQLGVAAGEARRIAERWRPWRAYGVMATWHASMHQRSSPGQAD